MTKKDNTQVAEKELKVEKKAEPKPEEPTEKRVPFSSELLPGFKGANDAVAESQRRLGEARAIFIIEEKRFRAAKERFEAAKKDWERNEQELMSSLDHAAQSRTDFLRLGHHASKLPEDAKLDFRTMEFIVESE